MGYPQRVEAKGVWYTKVIIGFLVIILVTSVLYPGHLWNRHDALIQESRDRMENLNYCVQRFFQVNGTYIDDIDSLMAFMETDSMLVERGFFEFEKLSLYDAPFDSFLIGFTDDFHFDHIIVTGYVAGQEVGEDVEADSVVLSLIPKDIYTDVINPVKVALVSPRGVSYKFREKGVDDTFWFVWSGGLIDRYDLPYEVKKVPSKDYLLFKPLADISIDPISGKPFDLVLNARVALEAEITYTKVDVNSDSSLVGNELYTNLFMNKLARKARSRLEQDIQRDSTLAEQQLALQSDYFDMELMLLRPGRDVVVDANRELTIPLDSVAAYNDSARIQLELFKITYDSLIRAWTGWEKTQEAIASMKIADSYNLGAVKIVGVTIKPPFEYEHRLRNSNLLDKLFSVGPVDYPGDIANNDLSWDEKR